MSESHPSSEGNALLRHVVPWGLRVVVLPSALHPSTRHYVQGSLPKLLQADVLVAATDATIVECAHGCAVVILDPSTWRYVRCSIASRALDSDPVAPETVARLLLLHLLCN